MLKIITFSLLLLIGPIIYSNEILLFNSSKSNSLIYTISTYDTVNKNYNYIKTFDNYTNINISENGKHAVFWNKSSSILVFNENKYESIEIPNDYIGRNYYAIDNNGNIYILNNQDDNCSLVIYHSDYYLFSLKKKYIDTTYSNTIVSGNGKNLLFYSKENKTSVNLNLDKLTEDVLSIKSLFPYMTKNNEFYLQSQESKFIYNIGRKELIENKKPEKNIDTVMTGEFSNKILFQDDIIIDNNSYFSKYFYITRKLEESIKKYEQSYKKVNPDKEYVGRYKDSYYYAAIRNNKITNSELFQLNSNIKDTLPSDFNFLRNPNILNIYDEDGILIFNGIEKYNHQFLNEYNYVNYEVTASSYYSDKYGNYNISNLKNYNLGNPWVEGKDDSGIGEIININANSNFSTIIIKNGFISTKKPELFTQNNRVARLKLFNNDFIMFVNLKDIKDPQTISLPFDLKNLSIEIIEIYKGENWDDTCIDSLRLIK